MIQEADKEGAFILAERLRKNISKLQDKALPKVSISMGIATYPVDGTDIDSLIKKADAALYEAKQKGRNKTVMYSDNIRLFREDQFRIAGNEQQEHR